MSTIVGWIRTADGWDHTEQRMKEILFQIRTGRPFKDIASQFDITVERISQIRHRAGIDRRHKPRASS